MREDIKMECPFNAKILLGSDPFAGDFGDGERLLKDVVSRVRKPFICHTCAEQRQSGEWARIRVEASDDGIQTFRWCTDCCIAECKIDDDGGDAMVERETIGDRNRAAVQERLP